MPRIRLVLLPSPPLSHLQPSPSRRDEPVTRQCDYKGEGKLGPLVVAYDETARLVRVTTSDGRIWRYQDGATGRLGPASPRPTIPGRSSNSSHYKGRPGRGRLPLAGRRIDRPSGLFRPARVQEPGQAMPLALAVGFRHRVTKRAVHRGAVARRLADVASGTALWTPRRASRPGPVRAIERAKDPTPPPPSANAPARPREPSDRNPVLELAGEIVAVSLHVEMAVAAEVEQDRRRLALFARLQRLVDRRADRVGRFRGRHDALRRANMNARLEARVLVIGPAPRSARAPSSG